MFFEHIKGTPALSYFLQKLTNLVFSGGISYTSMWNGGGNVLREEQQASQPASRQETYPMKKIRANFSLSTQTYVCHDKEIMGRYEPGRPHVSEGFWKLFLPLCVTEPIFHGKRATLNFGKRYEWTLVNETVEGRT